jgi:hypothetical protein
VIRPEQLGEWVGDVTPIDLAALNWREMLDQADPWDVPWQGLKSLRENSPLCRPFGTRFA